MYRSTGCIRAQVVYELRLYTSSSNLEPRKRNLKYKDLILVFTFYRVGIINKFNNGYHYTQASIHKYTLHFANSVTLKIACK